MGREVESIFRFRNTSFYDEEWAYMTVSIDPEEFDLRSLGHFRISLGNNLNLEIEFGN